MTRALHISLIVGVVASALTLAGFVLDPRDFLRSYLQVFLFALGLSTGALANLMLHGVTGGAWGVPLRAPLLAAARLVPLFAVLIVPVLAGLPELFAWARTGQPGFRGIWLQPGFFIGRAALYLAAWSLVAWRWTRLARHGSEMRPPALRRLSAGGLLVYGVTVSLAAVDWVMSLLPEWYSTGFGLLFGVAQMLSAMALGVLACTWLQRFRAREPALLIDLGNLLLMYVMSWAYLAFTQFLVIWAEDLPREIAWYLPRLQGSWSGLALALVLLQFALPFALLLSRKAKRDPRVLGGLAAGLLLGQLLFSFYLVTPSLRPEGFHLAWSDPVAVLAVLGLWCAGWLRNLRDAPGAAGAAS